MTSYPQAPEVDETGTTFEANARKKAVELALALSEWVLGEDSGLVVPALNGRPGVYSARYAGKQGDDAANNARLLAELAPLPADRREAYYVCTAALAGPDGRCGPKCPAAATASSCPRPAAPAASATIRFFSFRVSPHLRRTERARQACLEPSRPRPGLVRPIHGGSPPTRQTVSLCQPTQQYPGQRGAPQGP